MPVTPVAPDAATLRAIQSGLPQGTLTSPGVQLGVKNLLKGAGGTAAKASKFSLGSLGPLLGLMVAQMGISSLMGQAGEARQLGIEREGLERQAEAINPESMYYQAMLPEFEQREEQTRQALMQVIMGGGGQRQLATGQEIFGGV